MKQTSSTRVLRTVSFVLEPEEVEEMVVEFLRQDNSTQKALETAGIKVDNMEVLVNFLAKSFTGCRVVFHQAEEKDPAQEAET